MPHIFLAVKICNILKRSLVSSLTTTTTGHYNVHSLLKSMCYCRNVLFYPWPFSHNTLRTCTNGM